MSGIKKDSFLLILNYKGKEYSKGFIIPKDLKELELKLEELKKAGLRRFKKLCQ